MNIFISVALVLVAGPLHADGPFDESALSSADGLGAGARETAAKLGSCSAPNALFETGESRGGRSIVLHQNQLERCEYLLSATREEGTGEKGVFSSAMSSTLLISFRWTGRNIQLLSKQTYHRAAPGTPEERTVRRSFPDEVLGTIDLISSDSAKGTFTFAAERWFFEDMTGVTALLGKRYQPVKLSGRESNVEFVESLEKNLEAGVQLLFRPVDPRPTGLQTLAVRIRYSVSGLPEPGFESRPADPRVGHFTTTYLDYSRRDLKFREEPLVHSVNRWRLEKLDPDAALSEPKKPIVYWLEDTIPDEYRPAIRAGIESWNAAFEAIGFRNAIVVRDMADLSPAERKAFNPASVAYNMVRWYAGDKAGTAWGPSRRDPFTGEIFNGLVALADLRGRSELFSTRLGARGAADAADDPHARHDCSTHFVADARAAYEVLKARGGMAVEEMKRFMDEFLTGITAHEVGHTLGLRHNFKASSTVTDEDKANGIKFNSIMDYRLADIAAPGEKQGAYYQTRPGPYDFWAVEYAYKPLKGSPEERARQLEEIAGRVRTDPRLRYASDYEADDADPDVQRYDIGRDPIVFARRQAAIASDTWSRLAADAAARPQELRERLEAGRNAYYFGIRAVLPVIGGIRSSREVSGAVHSPVSAEEQRRALRFLDEAVFNAALEVPASVAARIGQDRLNDERGRPFLAQNSAAWARDYALTGLFQPKRLERLARRSELVADPADRFSVRDLFGELERSLWRELSDPRKQGGPERRSLQRRHVELLSELVAEGAPAGEVRAAARASLAELQARTRAAAGNKRLDADTRAHLADVQRSIEDVLRGPRARGVGR